MIADPATSLPPKRILYVEGNVDGTIGGSFYSLLYLVKGLDRRRFVPTVVFSASNPLIREFEAAGVEAIVCIPLGVERRSSALGKFFAKLLNFVKGYVAEPIRCLRIARACQADLVHLNNSIERNFAWMIATRLGRIPCITHERGINRELSPRAKLLSRHLKAIVCISASVRQNLERLGLARIRLETVPNGLDPAEVRVELTRAQILSEFGLDSRQRVIGIVGNIRQWKGQEVVVRAMGLLKDDFPDLACLLIGHFTDADLPYKRRIDDLITELGLPGRVIVVGFRKNIADYMNALDLVVHASIAPEPFGRVLLEAMALRKPIVASCDGAVPEIVQDGNTGFLFQPGNSAALAAQTRAVLEDPLHASAVAARGHTRLLEEFSIARNVERTQALYALLFSEESGQSASPRGC